VLTQSDNGPKFSALDADLRNLEKRLKDAYELCCTAPRLDGLTARPGIDLAALEDRVAAKRGLLR
jgi:hypothetical protein